MNDDVDVDVDVDVDGLAWVGCAAGTAVEVVVDGGSGDAPVVDASEIVVDDDDDDVVDVVGGDVVDDGVVAGFGLVAICCLCCLFCVLFCFVLFCLKLQ